MSALDGILARARAEIDKLRATSADHAREATATAEKMAEPTDRHRAMQSRERELLRELGALQDEIHTSETTLGAMADERDEHLRAADLAADAADHYEQVTLPHLAALLDGAELPPAEALARTGLMPTEPKKVEPPETRCIPYAALIGHQVEIITSAEEHITAKLIDVNATNLFYDVGGEDPVRFLPLEHVAAVRPAPNEADEPAPDGLPPRVQENGLPAVWDPSVPPGGYVCAVPDPNGITWHPDGSRVCGMPVESEPCDRHGPAGVPPASRIPPVTPPPVPDEPAGQLVADSGPGVTMPDPGAAHPVPNPPSGSSAWPEPRPDPEPRPHAEPGPHRHAKPPRRIDMSGAFKAITGRRTDDDQDGDDQ